ncbi:MAG: hypothetical protein R3C14_09980 [Caldilineaceae bacterium]
MPQTIFARAEEFIWKNARVLERQRFAYHFKEGAREGVLTALRAYQNADGGFGNALEPDIRCPESQPVPVQHALHMLDIIGFDADLELVQRACDYLQTITTAEGGVPWLLPVAHRYPRAPWWNTSDPPPAALNPTAAIAGILHKNDVHHPWLDHATAYCWDKIAAFQPTADGLHDMDVVLTFLYHVPDRSRAEQTLARLIKSMLAVGLVADVAATGYVRKPLEWAPTPDHPLRQYLRTEAIEANLEFLIAGQQPDGGWTIPWPPISPGCELEWRGWVTVEALLTLRANGRLS